MSSRLLRIGDREKLASDAGYEPERSAWLCSVSLRQLERFFKLEFGNCAGACIGDLKCRPGAFLIAKDYSTRTCPPPCCGRLPL
jgi:hypothetical protein